MNFGNKKPWTIAGWVATRSTNGVIVSMRTGPNNFPVINVVVSNGLLATRVVSDNAWQGQALIQGNNLPINDTGWHHFALVRRDKGSIELYQDGTPLGQNFMLGVTDGPITTSLRAVGCDLCEVNREKQQGLNPNFWHFCDCYLDEFCIFSRALSPQEIKKLAGRW